jgi:hypothetical protein
LCEWQIDFCFMRGWLPVHGPNNGLSAFARQRATNKGTTDMRKAILATASALALASPAVAADLAVPRYSEAPEYQREVYTYEYRTPPPVVVEEPAPVIVAPPRVVVDEYPVYAAPRVYTAPPVFAYAGPVWRRGGGHRHFHGRW